ncbi:helix-turn-helix domain-containing protein [Dactylosporangium sp. McL0621]|uniref:helix-turn-helix domain-containing protein n=1 Tax=Dactylosporangium sp. McL0621 TaxID=3415678 RepID=UPI003CE90167
MEKLLLTATEAAEVLNVGKSTVYDLIRLQVLKSVKLGRSRRIPMDACRELVARLVELPDGLESMRHE